MNRNSAVPIATRMMGADLAARKWFRNMKTLGMLEVSHEENPLFDPNGKYPLIGYQLFYRMDIAETLPFERENESLTRIWVETSEVKFVLDGHELLLDILEEAVRKKER